MCFEKCRLYARRKIERELSGSSSRVPFNLKLMSRSHPTEQVLATDLQPEEDGSLQAEKHTFNVEKSA